MPRFSMLLMFLSEQDRAAAAALFDAVAAAVLGAECGEDAVQVEEEKVELQERLRVARSKFGVVVGKSTHQ